jgi:hypothetical protein
MTERPDLPEALRRRLEARFAEDHADLARSFPVTRRWRSAIRS